MDNPKQNNAYWCANSGISYVAFIYSRQHIRQLPPVLPMVWQPMILDWRFGVWRNRLTLRKAIEDRKTWATVRRTKEERNERGEETAKWTMTKPQIHRSSSHQEATKPTNVAAKIHSVKTSWICECLVNCKNIGKVGTSRHCEDPSSQDYQNILWQSTTDTWTILSSTWRTK